MAAKSDVSQASIPRQFRPAVIAIVKAFAEAPRSSAGLRELSQTSVICQLAEVGFSDDVIHDALKWLTDNRLIDRIRGPVEAITFTGKRKTLYEPHFGPILFRETPRLWGLSIKVNNRKIRKRRDTQRKIRRLTPKQIEALYTVVQCKGSIAAAARKMGKDRKTIEQSYKAGLKKMGKELVKHGEQKHLRDRRGQDDVSVIDDRLHEGDEEQETLRRRFKRRG